MLVDADGRAPIPSASLIWTYPGSQVRVLFPFRLIEELRSEIKASARGDREVGGLLLASIHPGKGDVEIVDVVPIPSQADSERKHFNISLDWLDEVVARRPSDRKVVGFYRTDADQRVQLTDEDLAIIRSRFSDPSNIFLVIAPADGMIANAGLFVWQNGTLSTNSRLMFPLSAEELIRAGWPQQDCASRNERFRKNLDQVRSWLFRSSLWRMADKTWLRGETKLIVGAGLLCAVGAVILLVAGVTGTREMKPSSSFGLQVQQDGVRFMITWNPSSPLITHAKDAELAISDDSRMEWDGSKEPLYLPVTTERLQSGKLNYTSFAPGAKVAFRLDVYQASGNVLSERVASVSRNIPYQQPAVGDQPILAPTPPRSVSQKVAAANVIAEKTPRRRFFVAPISAPSAPDVSVLDPPQISPAAGTLTGSLPSIIPIAGPAVQRPAPTASVSAGGAQIVAATPAGPGVVSITSEPSGAEVDINSVRAGYTPLTVQISPVGLGFTVTVLKEGFVKWTLQTSATENPYSLHAQLRLSPK